MKIIQITDFHFKNEEPFFRAGKALYNYILAYLHTLKEPFVFLDSGDHFHISKETGRVNGEVNKFFYEVSQIDNCQWIFIMQGNHDIKEDTGSALDVLKYLKVFIVDKPRFIDTSANNDNSAYVYLLPHARPFSMEGYVGVKSYGEEEFHRKFWASYQNPLINWDEIKPKIKMVSLHGGDETTGKLFMNVDISFIPGIRSNGHIHKQISKNHLPSVSVTRRDEADKKCYIRIIDTETWEIEDKEIPLFLNYIQIPYGGNIDDLFGKVTNIKPEESLIVDIYGHDDRDFVIKEYAEKWKDRESPTFYIGEVSSVERKGESVQVEERDSLDLSSINLKELFMEFCEEKKLSKAITDDLLQRIA